MDNTNADRQRRWQSRHVIKPSLSADEIADRLKGMLDPQRLERVAELIGCPKIAANVGADADVNNAPGPLDRATLRTLGDLFVTLSRGQLRGLCVALMKRLRITAADIDRDLQRETRSLRARVRKATIAAKRAEYKANHPHND